MKTDISAIIDSFFRRFSQEFRQGKREAFEAIMALAIGHAFGCYNPNQWADYLGVTPQKIYAQMSTWSRYRLQQVLLKMMVHQACRQKSKQSKAKVQPHNLELTLLCQ